MLVPVARSRILWAVTLLALALGCRTTNGSIVQADETLATEDDGDASQNGTVQTGSLTLIGLVPARYLAGERQSDGYGLAKVIVIDGVIKSIEAVNDAGDARDNTLVLKNGDDFDVIYPGMINLHNHTKQNVLQVWHDAKGQFANRFEWRAWANYKSAVSMNMNPWIALPIATCAAFRWSELQALVIGTTYLQGPSSCIDRFAIAQVEDGSAYLADVDAGLMNVQAPTDLVIPGDMPFVWKHLKPLIDSGMTYEQALKTKITEFCPRLVQQFNIQDVLGAEELKVFKDKAKLIAGCDSDPDKFIRYLNWQHKNIAGKKIYFTNPKQAALVVHLAEGRRKDPYNTIEFEMLKLFGLDLPYVNLVHAVGVDKAGFEHMAAKNMGLIWSPFSNLLLYGETVDIKAAMAAGVTVALGSDWTPSGSRGVLEEMRIARAYAQKMGLAALITDERLFEMATENPAKMIHHAETDANDHLHGVGTIKVDAAGSFVVMSKRHANAYTNFVTGTAADIRLVTLNGRPLYGELALLKSLNRDVETETLPAYYAEMNRIAADTMQFPGIDVTLTPEQKTAKVAEMLNNPIIKDATPSTRCGFSKALVVQHSGEPLATTFKQASGYDLDRAADIQRVLALNLLTQSINRNPTPGKGNQADAVKVFPPMFACDDPEYQARVKDFINAETEAADEITTNRDTRVSRRTQQQLGSGPSKLANDYQLEYDPAIDY